MLNASALPMIGAACCNPYMLTGAELGKALEKAMTLKQVRQPAVAKEFGVKQPSVSEWIKFGRIGKRHIPHLVEWFAEVVGPEHWGLPPEWGQRPLAEAETESPRRAVLQAMRQLAALLVSASPMARKAAAPILSGLADAPDTWAEAANMLANVLGAPPPNGHGEEVTRLKFRKETQHVAPPSAKPQPAAKKRRST